MNLFDTAGFPPRWQCGPAWAEAPWVGWVHIVSDAATFVAYFAVPLVVVYFVRQQRSLKLPPVFYVFLGAVFFSCGLVHLVEAGIFWWPAYKLSGFLKLLTAAVSCAGVMMLVRVLPNAMELKSGAAFQREVDARKEAQASLEQERFLLQTLLKHMPEAIYFKDTEGRFTRVSSSLADWLGAGSPDEVVGKTDADYFSKEYADATRADEQALISGKLPLITKEEHPVWTSGRQTWVSTTKLRLHDESGRIIGTFGLSHDVTPLKEAEERFRSVVEATPNPMLVVDQEGEIRFVNRETERVFGYSRDELVGNCVEMLVPERIREEHVAWREAYFQAPSRRQVGGDLELMAERRDGSLFQVEIGLSPLLGGPDTAVLASVYDVTVREQTKEALIQAKEAAESNSRAKSDFVARMSHELRSPMHAIIGITELLLDTDLEPAQRDYLRTLMESAESLLAIINEVLDFSKIEAGKLKLESTDFNLREELGDAMRSLAVRAHDKGLELAWHVHSDVAADFCGDAGRLRQILVNLVGNAIKFTEQGEVVVDVRTADSDDDQARLHFLVRDTGVGIPDEKRESIFRSFEQADTSTTRQYGGTGLGLAITSRLVEAMQGRIWVESTPGEGSVFHFTVEMPYGSPTEAEDLHAAPDLHDIPVLVVDDNETNRRILEEMLANWGMQVKTASGAREAVRVLEQTRDSTTIPLLLSDVHMPEADGYQLAEQVRQIEGLDELNIILLTSGLHRDQDRCEQFGVDAYLMKPIKQSELLDAIMLVLGRRGDLQTPVHGDSAAVPDLPSLRVLLVEDGKANQKLAQALLSKWGHESVLAENGEEACQRWDEDGPFDLILMDVQMPVMDGFAATARIREREQQTGQHVPIVAMTARAMKGDREECLAAGMDAYVAKPVRQQELYEVLAPLFETEADETAHSAPQAADAPDDDALPEPLAVDWELALKTTDGHEDILVSIVEASLDEIPTRADDLETAMQSGDLERAQRHAHTIKSTARTFGCQPLLDVAQSVEESLHSQDRAAAQERFVELSELAARFCDELRVWAARHGH